MAQEAQRLMFTSNKMTQAMINGMRKSLQRVGLISAQDYLQGPRPEKLGIVSGRLIRSLMGGPSFAGGLKETGAPAVSRNEGIRVIKKIGDMISGIIGTDVPYARIHEYGGIIKNAWGRGIIVHMPERSYLRTAGHQADQSGEIDDIFQDEVDGVKHD